jgi:DNA-binding MarR family transcriptional regulator
VQSTPRKSRSAGYIDELELGSALRLTVGRLARQLRRHSVGGLTASQYSALAAVDRHGPLRPTELAASEGVSAPTLSRIVARLEERGYLSREADPADRRSYQVAVSADGRAALARIRSERAALLARGLAALNRQERIVIAKAVPALEQLVEHMGAATPVIEDDEGNA